MNYFLVLIGIFIFLYSFFDANIYASLFGDRAIYCPEEYKKPEQASDVSAVVHNIYLMLYGAAMVIIGLFDYVSGFISIESFILIVTAVSVFDVVFMLCIEHVFDMNGIKEKIKEKWKKEKVFKDAELHNHEVNMYRAVNNFQKYKKESCISMGFMLIVMLFFL